MDNHKRLILIDQTISRMSERTQLKRNFFFSTRHSPKLIISSRRTRCLGYMQYRYDHLYDEWVWKRHEDTTRPARASTLNKLVIWLWSLLTRARPRWESYSKLRKSWGPQTLIQIAIQSNEMLDACARWEITRRSFRHLNFLLSKWLVILLDKKRSKISLFIYRYLLNESSNILRFSESPSMCASPLLSLSLSFEAPGPFGSFVS